MPFLCLSRQQPLIPLKRKIFINTHIYIYITSTHCLYYHYFLLNDNFKVQATFARRKETTGIFFVPTLCWKPNFYFCLWIKDEFMRSANHHTVFMYILHSGIRFVLFVELFRALSWANWMRETDLEHAFHNKFKISINCTCPDLDVILISRYGP